MTIETFFEVNCDGCMQAHHDDTSANKSEVWKTLKERGWKRRKQFLWCVFCVERGAYAEKYVEWAAEE